MLVTTTSVTTSAISPATQLSSPCPLARLARYFLRQNMTDPAITTTRMPALRQTPTTVLQDPGYELTFDKLAN